jgi:ribose transport system ATP-binding protein
VRAVFGADKPDAGTVTFAGSNNRIAAPSDAIRAGMGFCSEDRKLEGIIPDMSVRENLTLALMPQLARRGIVDEARSREIVDRFIKRLGIRCAGPEQRIRELSGGNQQKVLLARWLCMNPKLLILDEPTRGIDVGAKAEILSLIRELAGQGLGVLMISSELEEVVEAASRIFVLRDGHTAAELKGDAVNEQGVMAAMAHGHEDSREEAHG